MVGSVFRPQINSSPQSATSFTVSNPTGQSATVNNDILYFSNPSAGSVYISWDGGQGL